MPHEKLKINLKAHLGIDITANKVWSFITPYNKAEGREREVWLGQSHKVQAMISRGPLGPKVLVWPE